MTFPLKKKKIDQSLDLWNLPLTYMEFIQVYKSNSLFVKYMRI
jgi:hypothetical protein